jgi:signal peptidase I
MVKKVLGLVIYFSLLISVVAYGRIFAARSGLVWDKISISGTGSMFPTFPKGSGSNPVQLAKQTVAVVRMRPLPAGFQVFGYDILGFELGRGDIVSFTNTKTREITASEGNPDTGFIKRVIALPGDTVEIRDGFVILNGRTLEEPYTAAGRSTFGGSYLPDCHPLKIPAGSVFVLGDNRKASTDSRFELGPVSLVDIDHVLPYKNQKIYSSGWHDAVLDKDKASQPTLDVNEYVNLLNSKRVANGLKPLKYQPKLAVSAKKRADIIIKYDDFSFAATRSGYTMAKAVKDAGYSNIILGEAPTQGFYDAAELIDNFFQFPDTKKFLLQSDFQETGLSAEVGNINGCPVQVVVQHFAGYKPPNYSAEMKKSWQDGLVALKKAYPGWQSIKNYPNIYGAHKADYDELLSLFDTRIRHFTAIVAKLQADQWLSDEENTWMAEDDALGLRMQALFAKLNGT